MKRILLSYPLSVNTPVYKDNPPVEIQQQSSIDQGDLYNQFIITSLNHNGTHIDGPWHFNPQGLKISEIPIDYFIFTHPTILDIPKGDDELITKADLEPYEHQIAGSDLLLIRTGFGKFRSSDPVRYSDHNPGFAADAASYLMVFDSLRAVGMDMISSGSVIHVDEAITFHQIMLGKGRVDGKFILLIEDMNLNHDLSGIEKVYAVPLYIEGVDSSFSTVFTEA
ncbi:MULTISPECIES: cyclase family protein [unclassified Paenibacillus]|uniref:cyclase family protein n=1 Tax=unclassified Paenibacillus TaxID=185978 RepID=UPI00122E7431|nr:MULTISPECIES: cyclase family protein [unclassified Paenibacillus]MBD8837347.1 cyclase family protein [Paenibacillus sp. CFBP 13594]